jgi:hypothetical protein
MPEIDKNTGFVVVEPKLGDFIRGGETGILDTAINPSGDWRPFYPTNQCQLMVLSNGTSVGDTNACVSFGAGQDVETNINFQLKNGTMISADNAAWLAENGYIDAKGSVFVSKRFIAKMSGTVPSQGNDLVTVWKSIQDYGCVPDSLWPMPDFDTVKAANPNATEQDYWNLYYEAIPDNVIALGAQFAARFPVLYEWLIYPAAPASDKQILTDLTVAPIEIATAVCAGWNTADPIQACGAGSQHATLMGFVETNGEYDILDHYVPWQKQFAPNYDITYGMRGVVGQGNPLPSGFVYVYTVNLDLGAPAGPEVKALQMGLQTVKDATGKPYMKPGVFGPFGPQTESALGRFQVDHDIPDAPQGHDFGPLTRTALTAALKA